MRLGLTARILIGGGLIALIFLIQFAFSIRSLNSIRQDTREQQRSQQAVVSAVRLEKLILDLETGTRGYVITHDERFLEPYRAAQRLLKTGRLKTGQPYSYEVHFHPDSRPALLADADEVEFEMTDRSPSLGWLEVPLRPLLEQGKAHNAMDEDVFHVFFTTSAFARAEQYARKGANASPSAVETAAALVGVLCSCPSTGDFFVVVTDAYEVMAAEQTVYSVTLSHESWRRILANVAARAAKCPAIRLLGQAHGHNYLPAGGQTCEACPTRAVCDLTNVFASEDDDTWTRAHFAGQPFSICAIFGLSARADRLHDIFTQHNARLSKRGYFVIPDFKPEQWPCRNAAARPGKEIHEQTQTTDSH